MTRQAEEKTLFKTTIKFLLRAANKHPFTFAFISTQLAIVLTVVAMPLFTALAIAALFAARALPWKDRLHCAFVMQILPCVIACDFRDTMRDMFDTSLDADFAEQLALLNHMRAHLLGFLEVAGPTINFSDPQHAEIVTALLAQVSEIDAELAKLPPELAANWPNPPERPTT